MVALADASSTPRVALSASLFGLPCISSPPKGKSTFHRGFVSGCLHCRFSRTALQHTKGRIGFHIFFHSPSLFVIQQGSKVYRRFTGCPLSRACQTTQQPIRARLAIQSLFDSSPDFHLGYEAEVCPRLLRLSSLPGFRRGL